MPYRSSRLAAPGSVALAAMIGLAAGGALGSCNTTSTTISGDDSTFLGSGRVSLPLDNEDTAIELDVGLGSGGFDQNLGVGESLELDTITFFGPGTVAVDFDLLRVYAAARKTFTEENGLGIALIFGLGMTKLDAIAAMGGTKDDFSDTGFGLLFGLEPFYRLSERTKVYGELMLLSGVSRQFDGFDHTSIDLGVAFAPLEAVELAAGWRSWRYEAEGGFDSDLDLSLRGPHLSLRITP